MTLPGMRDRFSDVVSSWLDADPRAALVLADIGVDRFQEAARRYPNRVINVGIREQSLIGVTAGLALEGFRPVAHTYAPFLVERPFEQVKLDLGHQDVGAILVSVGASYDWAEGGRTHHAPEDVALVATLPGWEIHVPGHADELETLFRHATGRHDACYIRLAADHNAAPVTVVPGRLSILRTHPRSRATVVAVGPMLDPVRDAVSDLEVDLLYAATVRPFDGPTLAAVARSGNVVLVEPYLRGTSAFEVSEALQDRRARLLSLGVPRAEHRRYGQAKDHAEAFGLHPAGLRASILAFLAAG